MPVQMRNNGRLIIEIYEIVEGRPKPAYEPASCELNRCFKKQTRATLAQIMESAFAEVSKRDMDSNKKDKIMQLLRESGFERIEVCYVRDEEDEDSEACVVLENVKRVTLSNLDARKLRRDGDAIILTGKYRMARGGNTTLYDAQRITLIYSDETEEQTQGAYAGQDAYAQQYDAGDQSMAVYARTIQLHITFLLA